MASEDPVGFLLDFAVAAGIGGLIGVEREHRPDQQQVVAGVRTFPLIATAGYLTAFLARLSGSPFVLAAGLLGIFAFALMLMVVRQGLGQHGITTPSVMVITFFLGVLVGYGYLIEATAVGVAATALLVTKERLHRFANILEDTELLSALQFVTLLFILLPLTRTMPSEIYGQRWLGRGALVDPYVILLVVVFVSAISFASLVAMRQVGPRRGLAVSGTLGGLVNSEATTASLAQRARDHPELLRPALMGAILASTTMLVRNLAIAGFADPSLTLMKLLAPLLVPIAIVGGWYAWRLRGRPVEAVPPVRVGNPFAVGPALRFALIFAAVSLVASLARDHLGEWGVYVAALGGFVSAGAVIASMAGLLTIGALPVELALRVCVLATGASLAGKLVIIRAVDRDMLRPATAPFAAMTAAALVAVAAAFAVSW